MDPAFATTTELTGALADRSVSSRELLEHLVARVEEHNPRLNAVVALDLERARREAVAADEQRMSGEPAPPLLGLPMTVKDVWETEGLVTTSGAPELRDHVPTADALAVARLRAAGAVIFGKTNTPLYAGDLQTFNDVYGRTNNPWDTSRTTGGSSGGSAAVVAAGLSPLELGSDIGGSIRNPAHFNGVYGIKPSWGVVPSRGHIPGPPGSRVEPDVNCNGPLARGLADLALALDIVAGPLPEDAPGWRLELDPGPPLDGVGSLRIATVFDEGRDLLPVASGVLDLLRGFADRLADAGARLTPVPLPVPLADGFRSWQDLVLPIIGAGMDDATYDGFRAFDAVSADDPLTNSAVALVSRYRTWAHADAKRQHQRAAWAALFEQHDVVLAPVMATAAFPHDTDRGIEQREIDVDGTAVPHLVSVAWCGSIGAVLLPVVVVPVGRTPDGLPVGIQIIGPFLSDRRLLGIAEVLDEVAGPGFSPPPGF
jgi:amidase